MHKRKPWKRPQSDYGNRLGARRKSDSKTGDGRGGADDTGLDTLQEEDGSIGGGKGHRRGSGLSGDDGDSAGKGKGDGKDGKDGLGSASRTSSTDSSRRRFVCSKIHLGLTIRLARL